MSEKATRDVKLKGLSAIAAIAIGSLVVIGAWFTFGKPLTLNSASTPDTVMSSSLESVGVTQAPADETGAIADSTLAQDPPPTRDTTSASATSPKDGRRGLLRVGNLSEHPVRIAILLRKDPSQVGAQSSSYEPPAHWDFEPGEGRLKGLVLSLPNRSLKLKKGDILVAFAQDGSRRYWGPYVLGDTADPVWDPKAGEWQLILEP